MIKGLWIRVRKYGWYSVLIGALLLGVVFLILRNILFGRPAKVTSAEDSQLRDFIQKKQNEIRSVEAETSIRIAVERTKEAEIKKELEEVVKIDNTEERLDALIKLRSKVINQ